MNRINLIRQKVYSYKQMFLEDLIELVSTASWRDEETISEKHPFGKNISNTFTLMKKFCLREGLSLYEIGGYAFHSTLERPLNICMALAVHLDTVPIHNINLWESPPLELTEKNGIIYGLGVNDAKGPALVCLYTLKIIKELNLIPNYSLRIIFGGAEETTWECIQKYQKEIPDPNFVLVSDGNFPLVLIEKGMLRVKINMPCPHLEYLECPIEFNTLCFSLKITYNGAAYEFNSQKIPARHPYRGKDALNMWADTQKGALFQFIKKWDDGHGLGFKAQFEKEDLSANYSNTFALVGAEKDRNFLVLYGDIRYMTEKDRMLILENIQKELDNLSGKIEIILERPLVNESQNSPFAQVLLSAYQDITQDKTSQAIAAGAMSYARAFKKALAFGPCFPNYIPSSHRENESMPIKDLLEAVVIYIETIIRLHENIFTEEYSHE